MKIAIIGHKRVPSREGGIEKTVEKQALRLRDRGHEVILYNRSGHNIFGPEYDADKKERPEGIRIVTVPTPKNALGVPIYAFLATILALLAGCDVLYYHASGPCIMIPFARLFGARCAAMLHGIDSRRAKWGRAGRWLLRLGERSAAQKADVCFVLSNNMSRYIEKKYGRKPVIMFNGAEPPSCPEEEADGRIAPLGLCRDDYLLTLVRIVPEKGLHYLIRAFRACRTDKKLVIAGGVDPACREYYSKLKELAGGDPRILFTGFVEEPVVCALYLCAYAFILPSDLEGMAHSLLEAMAAGSCCLVSDIPENRDVVGQYGLTFVRSQTKDLRKKLQRLLDDEALVRRYREGAAAHVLEKYSWDLCVDRIETIFEEIRKKDKNIQ